MIPPYIGEHRIDSILDWLREQAADCEEADTPQLVEAVQVPLRQTLSADVPWLPTIYRDLIEHGMQSYAHIAVDLTLKSAFHPSGLP